MKNQEKSNPSLTMTFEFALLIFKYTEKLESLKRYNVANQLFRSGTSIGANIREAQSAESRADFIHKIKIAAKETEETEYWLLLCKESYPFDEILLDKINQIGRLLTSIITTSKKRAKEKNRAI